MFVCACVYLCARALACVFAPHWAARPHFCHFLSQHNYNHGLDGNKFTNSATRCGCRPLAALRAVRLLLVVPSFLRGVCVLNP